MKVSARSKSNWKFGNDWFLVERVDEVRAKYLKKWLLGVKARIDNNLRTNMVVEQRH